MSPRTSSLRSVPKSQRYVVIMAGGVGSRFWPWSREASPKQLLPLTGDQTMIEETAARVRGVVPDENVLVVTAERLGKEVRRRLPWLTRQSVLCEPQGRNTAPCIGWAALEILARNRDGTMAVLAADHVVKPRVAFQKALRQAFSVATYGDHLLTFGIAPETPATGYGYIEAGPALRGTGGVRKVLRFHEKPALARAKAYVKSGNYFWNSGMFVWRADAILDAIGLHQPRLAAGLAQLESTRRRGRIPAAALAEVYGRLDSISIDNAILEKSDRVVVLPAPFSWSDIGSWDVVSELWPTDAHANTSRDQLICVDARSNIVASRGKPVALLGVEGLVIVDSGDALLVCSRDRCQDVRKIVEALKRAKMTGLL